MVDLYYKGYHTTLEGKYIFDAIKLYINKYRLTTNTNLSEKISLSEVDKLISKLYLQESPYVVIKGLRYYRNTTKLISESVKIAVIDEKNNRNIYDSISECAKDLKISRNKIKDCLSTGEIYKGYIFVIV